MIEILLIFKAHIRFISVFSNDLQMTGNQMNRKVEFILVLISLSNFNLDVIETLHHFKLKLKLLFKNKKY